MAAVLVLVGCSSTPSTQPINAPSSNEPLGETKANSIEVCMPAGERTYLSSLVCSSGEHPKFSRDGNVGARVDIPRNISDAEMNKLMKQALGEPLQPGEVDHHFVDVYSVSCGNAVVKLYFDMYHCNKPASTTAPRGFSMGGTAP
jgi:hypothetical protein